MTRGIFVTATDTGVGKSVVSAVLIRALQGRAGRVGAMKPFETGCEARDGVLFPADGAWLKNAAGMDESLDLVTPVRFVSPLAPSVASGIEGRPVELETVFGAFETLSRRCDLMVVEGIGGVMVPLASPRDAGGSHPFLVTDLIVALRLPVIVVARPALGTINHTLLTLEALLRRGIQVAGVIINHNGKPDGSLAEATNPAALRELCPVPVLGEVPYLAGRTAAELEQAAAAIDMDALLSRAGLV